MLADAHLHLFSHGYGVPRIEAQLGGQSDIMAYERFRQAHDIVAGLVVGYEADGIDPDNNSYLRHLASGRPWLHSLAFCAVRATPDAEWVRARLAEGHRGLAIYLPDAAAARALADWPVAVWRLLDNHGAIVSLNARPEATTLLAPLIAAAPGCRFLFSHVGLPGRHAAPVPPETVHARMHPLLALSDQRNVFVKISGLYAISDPPDLWPQTAAAAFVAEALANFGPQRCLWGSDFSPALEYLTFDQTCQVLSGCKLTADETAQIMADNLLQLLAQDGQAHGR